MLSFLQPVGRITRRKFLIFFLVFFFANLLFVLEMWASYQINDWTSFVIYGILVLITIYVLLVQSAKRLHDLGYSRKYALYLLIPPPINFIGFVWLSYKEGQVGDNQYGKDPRKTDMIS
jgi:uncharacterized membrane protein YhaH (DUF805 family)